MRILRIADINGSLFGGMSKVMHLTTDQLSAAGHEVVTLFRGSLNQWTPEKLRRFVVPFDVVRCVRKRVRAGDVFDVVEVHEPTAAIYCIARRVIPGLPPIVVITHGLEALARVKFLAYRKRKELPVSFKSRYSPLSVVWQANYALRHAEAVVCSTTDEKSFLEEQLKIPSERIHFINWGALPQYFADPPPARSGILCHGTWIERKGIRDMVAAVVPLFEKRPELRMTLSGCGLPAKIVASYFPASVHSQLRIIDRQISEGELVDLYLQHSVFVSASFFEGQSLTLFEAAASGIAIVTTNVGGMRDFVRHGENGLLCDPGDVELLAAHLERLVGDDAEARRLGDEARRDARRYSWERGAENLLGAYQAAIAACRRDALTVGDGSVPPYVERR
jgi:glycosyltransferase involved in cell wall biosynthesis